LGLRGILFDFDGPLVVDHTCTPRDGVIDLLKALNERGLIFGAMSNRPKADIETRSAKAFGGPLALDSIHCATDPGCKKKMGGSLVASFCQNHGLMPHEILVVGDDKQGVVEALNGRAFGFHASWGDGVSEYGIHVDTPEELLDYLDVFFLKKHYWYAAYSGCDSRGRVVELRSLIDGNGAHSENVKKAIIETLKERKDARFAGASFSKFLMAHMLASAYLDGLFSAERTQLLWQVYPGHDKGSKPPPVIQATIESFKLFRSKASEKDYYGIRRWKTASRSSTARVGGDPKDRAKITFGNQLSTICLAKGTKVSGKRVYVIDDFCTEGYSLEAARNLYSAAGAKIVYLFAFGKYGDRFQVDVPDQDLIRPFVETKYNDADFTAKTVHVHIDPEALPEFIQSLKRLKGSPIAGKLLN
jgi:hypothetical protein